MCLLGEIAAHADPPEIELAEARYGEALTLATELGMRPLIAHCYLGLGGLCRRASHETRAEEHLTMATTLYREMGMNRWLAQAEAMREPRR